MLSVAAEGAFPILGERDELLRVVENLIENAVKYGGGGGRVEVSLRRQTQAATERTSIELAVRDYGPGIAAEHIPRLTERFYRVDVASSRDQGGTGLGLAIVKHIVNRHRGRLLIESVPDEGTTVRAVFPEFEAAEPPDVLAEPA
jgi:two-component system phosphate regulon sensor histidine kinase PhoR